jgi:DNA-binding PadR family transcriptional regulator
VTQVTHAHISARYIYGVDLSPTAYVILGMLRSGPKSGYEIKALVDHSTRFFWAASYGQIYPELRRLAEAGLVEGADAARDGRRRTVYKLTPAGRRELRDEGLLKLFFAAALPPEEAAGTLRSMREHHLSVAERLREIEPKAIAAGGSPLMVLRGGIEYHEHFADWCQRMERQLIADADEREAG